MSTPEKNLDYEENTSVTDVHASVKREKEDPQTGLEPATIKVFAICAVFLLFGGVYFGATAGDFSSSSTLEGYVPVPPDTGELPPPPPPEEQWLKDGKSLYGACAACHGGNGLGLSAAFPPLAGSEWVTGGTERLAALVLHGLNGPITVKGKGYNGEMPPHKSSHDSKELAQVFSYIRNTWGNEGSFVMPEMVDAAREKFADQSGAFTAATLPPADTDLPGELPEWAGGPPAAEAEGDAAPAEDAAPAPAE